jgi:hypothetical protein
VGSRRTSSRGTNRNDHGRRWATTGEATQAGALFVWQASVATTPNPAFRRIDIAVAEPQAPDYALARLVGFLGNPDPRR